MPRYSEQDYTLTYALENIRLGFWQEYHEDLYSYAVDRSRTDILEKIHKEWTLRRGKSRNGTEIRIEWAIAIYEHGDWEKALAALSPNCHLEEVKAGYIDPRKNYPAEYRCDNGVYVRSLSELCIANWFYANKIQFDYERAVLFEHADRSVLCDFYLPQENVYIEFWGKPEDEEYAQYMRRKETFYAQSGYKLMSLYPNDLKNFRDQFNSKLRALKIPQGFSL